MTTYRKGNKGVVDVSGDQVVGWWQYGTGGCALCREGGAAVDGLLLHATGKTPLFLCLSCVGGMWALRPITEEVTS